MQQQQQQQPGRLRSADVACAAGPLVGDEEAERGAAEEEAGVATGRDQLEDGEATLDKVRVRVRVRISGEDQW